MKLAGVRSNRDNHMLYSIWPVRWFQTIQKQHTIHVDFPQTSKDININFKLIYNGIRIMGNLHFESKHFHAICSSWKYLRECPFYRSNQGLANGICFVEIFYFSTDIQMVDGRNH